MLSYDSKCGVESFPTDNIKLAAILFTLGFQLMDGMPVDKRFQSEWKESRHRWHFTASHQWGDYPLTAAVLDNWYRHKAEFEARDPDHPVTWMRQALDAREWLYQVKHGEANLKPIVSAPLVTFETDEIQLAACLVSARYQLLKISGRTFKFWDDGNCAKIERQYRLPFDAERREAHLPVTWRREVLRARDSMAEIMRDPRCQTMIMMRHKGHAVLLSKNADRETKYAIFST
jgi:hypothetical protein